MTNDELIKKIKNFYRYSKAHEKEWRENAKEAFEFVRGKQWTDEQKSKLENEGRPALTFNRISPIIDVVRGMQRQTRFDVDYIPIGNQAENRAQYIDIIRQTVKDIEEDFDEEFKTSEMFDDGMICGRGYLWRELRTDEDPRGKICFKRINPLDVLLDPNSIEYDYSDGEFMIKRVWMTLDQVKREFGDEAKELTDDLFTLEESREAQELVDEDNRIYEGDENWRNAPEVPTDYVDPVNRRILVLFCAWKDNRKVQFIFDPQTNGLKQTELTIKQFNQLKKDSKGKLTHLTLIKKLIPKIRYTTIAVDKLLRDEDSPFDDSYFPILPFFAYYQDGKQWGIVEKLKDPQREVNKRRSQILHIIGTIAKGNLIIPKGSVDNVDAVRRNWGNVATVVEYDQQFGKPEVVFSSAPFGPIIQMEAEGKGDLKEISLVADTMQGVQPSRIDSGVALNALRQQATMGLTHFFDNLWKTKKFYGKLLMKMIQQTYTDNRTFPVVEKNRIRYVTVGPKNFDGEWKVAVSRSPNTATIRQANFLAMIELARYNVPIPPDLIIEMSDFPEKEKLVARIQQYMQSQKAEESGEKERDRMFDMVMQDNELKVKIAQALILDKGKFQAQQGEK